MLILAVSLAVLCSLIELATVFSVPWLGRQLEHHMLFSVVFSVGVSAVLGFLFGAAGLVVTFAAVLSTLLSLLVYRLVAAVHWAVGIVSPKGGSRNGQVL